jgi:hypothetical protein
MTHRWEHQDTLTKMRPLLFLGLAWTLLPVSGCGTCENVIVSELSSPDHQQRAVIFVRSCGATTAYGTNVSVIGSSERLPDDRGNVLVIDDDHGRVRAGDKGSLPVVLKWTASNEVVVEYPRDARVFRAESNAGRIHIQYTKTDEPERR